MTVTSRPATWYPERRSGRVASTSMRRGRGVTLRIDTNVASIAAARHHAGSVSQKLLPMSIETRLLSPPAAAAGRTPKLDGQIATSTPLCCAVVLRSSNIAHSAGPNAARPRRERCRRRPHPISRRATLRAGLQPRQSPMSPSANCTGRRITPVAAASAGSRRDAPDGLLDDARALQVSVRYPADHPGVEEAVPRDGGVRGR